MLKIRDKIKHYFVSYVFRLYYINSAVTLRKSSTRATYLMDLTFKNDYRFYRLAYYGGSLNDGDVLTV